MSTTRHHRSSLRCAIGSGRPAPPTKAARRSAGPSVCSTSARRALTASHRVRSRAIPTVHPPAPRISAVSASIAAGSRGAGHRRALGGVHPADRRPRSRTSRRRPSRPSAPGPDSPPRRRNLPRGPGRRAGHLSTIARSRRSSASDSPLASRRFTTPAASPPDGRRTRAHIRIPGPHACRAAVRWVVTGSSARRSTTLNPHLEHGAA